VQAVDRMIASLQDTLTKAGVAGNTDIVFSSDNGYHMGEYRLTPGKMTAFDTDVNVPLVAAGPGIRAGSVISDPAQNIDLAPTFETLAGAATPATVDGRSLIPLLSGQSDAGWRTTSYTYVEYTDGTIEYYNRATDPDELHNIAGQLPASTRTALHTDLTAMTNCHGDTVCWTASHLAH